MPSTELRRHDRVWLEPATWTTHLAARDAQRASEESGESALASLIDWVARGRALVVRRRDGPDGRFAPDACFLGVALPLAAARRRIAIVVERAAVVRVAPPLALDEVVAYAPDDRRPALAALQRAMEPLDTTLRVYGSYAWQAISGEACVTPSSDLDLTWDAHDGHHARRVIAALMQWESTSGLRADGEVRLSNGDAIAWRELASGAPRVLVKRDDGVALVATPLADTPHEAVGDRARCEWIDARRSGRCRPVRDR